MGRLIDLTLAPLYTTVGLGDMLADRAARREVLEAAHQRIDSVVRRGRHVTVESISGLPVIGAALGARIAHDEMAAERVTEREAARGATGFSLLAPLTNPVATLSSLTGLLVRRENRSETVPLDIPGVFSGQSTYDPLRSKRTAASRTSSPAPTPHRQPMVDVDEPSVRLTSTRTVRPSGMEAASTATRAARRAAQRAEHQ